MVLKTRSYPTEPLKKTVADFTRFFPGKELPRRRPRIGTHRKRLMPDINRESILFTYDIFTSGHGITHTEHRKIVKLSI